MEKETLKWKIEEQIHKLKEMIEVGCNKEEIKREERILNQWLKEYLKEEHLLRIIYEIISFILSENFDKIK